MSKNFRVLTRFCFVFIVIVFGNYIIVAQTTLSGTWKTGRVFENRHDKSDEEDSWKKNLQKEINLQFRFDTDSNSSQGASFDYSELQGLSKSQVEAANSKVNFKLIREAGTIEFKGVFQNGKGEGSFRFTADPQFVSAMRSRGFDFNKEEFSKYSSRENRLFSAALFNVTTALADDLQSANFANLDSSDLIKAKVFNIDSKFLRELKASGFANLDMEDAVKARIFKIDGAYLRELTAAGLGNESFENVVKMRIFKITPEFIAEIKQAGIANPAIEDLVKMRIFNINGAFIRQSKAEGVPLEVKKLVQKRIGIWGKFSKTRWY